MCRYLCIKTYNENCNLLKNCRVGKSYTEGTCDCSIIIWGIPEETFRTTRKKSLIKLILIVY